MVNSEAEAVLNMGPVTHTLKQQVDITKDGNRVNKLWDCFALLDSQLDRMAERSV